MDEQITSDKFKLWGKWFWIGMVISFFDVFTGLIFGIALIFEKDRRREGLVVILFALTCFVLKYFVLAPWLKDAGYLPGYTVLNK
jgi:hypothetical protein